MSSIYDFFLLVQALVLVFFFLSSFCGLSIWLSGLLTIILGPLLYFLEMVCFSYWSSKED